MGAAIPIVKAYLLLGSPKPLSTLKLIICLLLHVRVLKGFVSSEHQSCSGIGRT